MARITKPAAERRQEIIDTARILFTKSGFDKTQISDIAQEINVAQGLVYNYFKSKNELLYAVIDELANARSQEIELLLQKAEGTALNKLMVLLDSQPNMDNFGELISSLIQDTAIAEYCSSKMTLSVMPALLELVRQGNADQSWQCNHPKETVLFILHGLSGFMDEIPQVDEEKRRILTEIVLRVLGASPLR